MTSWGERMILRKKKKKKKIRRSRKAFQSLSIEREVNRYN